MLEEQTPTALTKGKAVESVKWVRRQLDPKDSQTSFERA